MSSSSLGPQEIRAAAEAHKELGPEYEDSVIASFLERVDREIDARVDARLGPASRQRPVRPSPSNSRRALLAGVAIGILVTGVPAIILGHSGASSPGNEEKIVVILAILWVVVLGVAVLARPVRQYLDYRREYSVRQARQ